MFVYVENDKIVEGPKKLPTSWKNISNLDALDEQSLKNYGWFPYRFVSIDLQPNQSYNGSNFVFENDEVVEYQLSKDLSSEEFEIKKLGIWKMVRIKRNKLLTESDWTQLSDCQLSELKKNEWKLYRQELRDITLQADVFNVIWPNQPE